MAVIAVLTTNSLRTMAFSITGKKLPAHTEAVPLNEEFPHFIIAERASHAIDFPASGRLSLTTFWDAQELTPIGS